MKVKKGFGVFFTCAGCIAAFIGLAATVLPVIQNDQLQLVLASFEAPASSGLVNAMNAAMTYALHNCYLVLGVGLGVALIGIFLLVNAANAAEAASQPQRRAARAYIPPADGGSAIPAWRSSKAAEVTPQNPFASPALGDQFAAVTSRSDRRGAYERPAEPAQTFAPAVQAQLKTAEPAPRREAEASPYARPAGEAPSPYARPAQAEAAATPYQRPEAAQPVQAAARQERYEPVYQERPLNAAAEGYAQPTEQAAAAQPAGAGQASAALQPASAPTTPPAQPVSPMQPVSASLPVQPIQPVSAAAPQPAAPAFSVPPITGVPAMSAAAVSPAASAPAPQPSPVSPAPAPVKKPVKIKSTMGKHSC